MFPLQNRTTNRARKLPFRLYIIIPDTQWPLVSAVFFVSSGKKAKEVEHFSLRITNLLSTNPALCVLRIFNASNCALDLINYSKVTSLSIKKNRQNLYVISFRREWTMNTGAYHMYTPCLPYFLPASTKTGYSFKTFLFPFATRKLI